MRCCCYSKNGERKFKMAKSKNPLLPSSKITKLSKLVQPDSGSSTALPRLTALGGTTRSSSFSAKPIGTALSFGKPSSARFSTSSSGNILTGLLKQTASGGIASALGGGLSSFLGLSGLISGFASLFGGGKNELPPLV